jgi:hypothetical protein
MTDRPLKDETLLAHAGNKPQANFGIVNPPVYHASTILFPTVAALEEMTKDKIGNITYGRFGTPTTFALEEAVASAMQVGSVSKLVWLGRIISGLMILFMLFDGGIKLLKMPAAVEGTARLGYPTSLVQPIGILALVCALLYAIPRTSVLGAILLTGYLGGATATQVRVQDPWFLFPVVLGMLIWAGLYFRDERLRALVPLSS